MRAPHVCDQIILAAFTPHFFDGQTLQLIRIISGVAAPNNRLQALIGNIGGDDRQLVIDSNSQQRLIGLPVGKLDQLGDTVQHLSTIAAGQCLIECRLAFRIELFHHQCRARA